jgi:hypothetical protein
MPSLRRAVFRHLVASDRDALRSDWQSIGEDFVPGLRIVTDELMHSKEAEHVG